MRTVICLLVLLGCWAAPLSAAPAAGPFQPLDGIRAAVLDFIRAELGDDPDVRPEVKPLDARLRLHACEQPLRVFWGPGARRQGNTTLGVACEGERPWKIYVQARIAVWRPVAVAARALLRGERLRADDVRLEKRDVSRLRGGYLDDAQRFVGYRIRQNIPAGRVLQPRQFAAPRLVRRGERVTLVARNGTVQVRMAGEALADGALGATVRVRNLSSRRIVQGEVVGKGRVLIHF